LSAVEIGFWESQDADEPQTTIGRSSHRDPAGAEAALRDVSTVATAAGIDTSGDKSQGESFEYLVRPIVSIVPRGSAPAAIEARRKEAELLRNRIQSCDEAQESFRSMRDAAIRDQLTKTSADSPPNSRESLDKMPVGKLTPPEVTKQGVEMVASCSRKPTKADT
ncbi:hypothetical protein OY671_011324, partial [Metschnikowia pulcherrima]